MTCNLDASVSAAGCTLIYCNVRNRFVCHKELIEKAAQIGAGIIGYTEPNQAQSVRDRVILSNSEMAGAHTNRNLVGTATEWKTDDNFVSFKWQNIYFFCVYLSPNDKETELNAALTRLDIEMYYRKGPKIIFGDFNCRTEFCGDSKTEPRGRILEDWLIGNNLMCLNDKKVVRYTFSGHQGNSVPDLLLASSELKDKLSLEVSEKTLPGSDHHYLIIKVNSGTTQSAASTINGGWYLDNKKYAEYAKLVRSETIKSDRVSDLTPGKCREIIESASNQVFKRKDTVRRYKPAYWWNDEIKKIRKNVQKLTRKISALRGTRKELARLAEIAEEDRNFEEWSQMKSHVKYTDKIIRKTFELKKTAEKLLSKAILKSQSNNWKQLISDLDNDPWGTAYKIVKKKIKSPRTHDENTLSNAEIAEIITELFPAHDKNEWERPHFEEADVPPITEEELRDALKRLKTGKAPGPDCILPMQIKIYLETNIKSSLKMFNSLLIKAEFPKSWKEARLVLLPKPPKNGVKKYRPLCMLNTISKIMEYILYGRLLKQVKISDNQYGFMKGRSTLTAMQRLQQIFDDNAKTPWYRRDLLCAVGLDIKNAFNSLRWKDVIQSLEKQKVSPYLIAMIQSYLSDRKIIIGDITIDIFSGAAQGSILGPLLWILVYDDVIKTNSPEADKLGYADDVLLVIRAKNKHDLIEKSRHVTKQIKNKLDEKELTLEASKSEATLLSRKKVDKDAVVIVDNTPVPVKTSQKYIGFHLYKGLSMSHHVEQACKKAKRATASYRCLLPNVKGPSFLKRKLIVSAIMSIIFYGVTIWHSAMNFKKNSQTVRKTLRPLKRSLCMAYRTVSDTCLDMISGVPPADLLVEERVRRARKDQDANEIRSEIYAKWRERWTEDPGDIWFKTLVKNFDDWIYRDHGSPDYYISQFLSGHGCFGSYLCRMKIFDSSNCRMCKTPLHDSPKHAFFECESYKNEREVLEGLLDTEFRPDTVIGCMLESKEKWSHVHKYVRKILEERQPEYNDRGPKQVADVMSQDDSGISRAGN